MRIRRSISLLAVALFASAALGGTAAMAAPPGEAGSDAVVKWNAIAATTLAAVPGPDGGAPPAFQINMGMTQGAVYDAVNAIGPKRHRPYLPSPRASSSSSPSSSNNASPNPPAEPASRGGVCGGGGGYEAETVAAARTLERA